MAVWKGLQRTDIMEGPGINGGGGGGGRMALMEAGSAVGMAGTGEGTLPAGKAYIPARTASIPQHVSNEEAYGESGYGVMLDEDSKIVTLQVLSIRYLAGFCVRSQILRPSPPEIHCKDVLFVVIQHSGPENQG